MKCEQKHEVVGNSAVEKNEVALVIELLPCSVLNFMLISHFASCMLVQALIRFL
jgi:hypothetical protein